MLDRRFRSSNLLLIMAFLVVVLNFGVTHAQDTPSFFERQQVGVRFGGWSNQGDLPDTTFFNLKTDVGNSSFYAEFYFAWRVYNRGYLEFSAGFVNRGEVSILADPGTIYEAQYIGNLMMYPILIQLKQYFPGFNNASFKPYVTGGGGLYISKHAVQFTDSYYTAIQEPSRTKLGWSVGGGFDWPVSSTLALEGSVKYYPIEYGDDLFSIKDFSAMAFMVGIKYSFIPTKKKNGSRPR